MKYLLAIYALLALTIFPGIRGAQASFISMESTFTVTDNGKTILVEASSTNRGDEPARNVLISIELQESLQKGTIRSQLPVGGQLQEKLSFQDILPMPGRYPVSMTTTYEDSNGHQFSALLLGLHDHIEKLSSEVEVIASSQNGQLTPKGRISFDLYNRGSTKKTVRCTLYTAKEIVTQTRSKDITLNGNGKERVYFDLHNQNALNGSQYAIFLAFSYIEGQHYFSNMASQTVKIIAPTETGSESTIYQITALLLAAIFIFLQLKRRR